MPVAEAKQRREICTTLDLVAWVQEGIYAGLQPNEAAEAAFNEAVAQDRAADVLAALGWRFAFYVPWQERNRGDRFRRFGNDADPAPAEELLAASPLTMIAEHVASAPPTPRRVDPRIVRDPKSLYSKLINIGDHQWVPLGSLKKGQCLTIAAGYRVREKANAQLAYVYETLGDGLEDDQTTVEKRFSEAELDALWPQAA